MFIWHQDRFGPVKIPAGYAILSDGPSQGLSLMTFGEDRAEALHMLSIMRRREPKTKHTLCYNGKPVV